MGAHKRLFRLSLTCNSMTMPREHGQQGLVSVLDGLVYSHTAAVAEISCYVRPSPYVPAEKEEK